MRQDTWEKGGTLLGEGGVHCGEHHDRWKSCAVKTVLECWLGGSEPRGHHGLAPSDKCHCNFDACVFAPILQNSSLDQKKKKKNSVQSI